jgi:hypothetical protein
LVEFALYSETKGSTMSDLRLVAAMRSATPREANALAEQLGAHLAASAPGISTELVRTRSDTQELGSAIAIILSAPAVIAAVRAIAAFLQKHQSASLDITTKDGRILLQNVTSQTALEALRVVAEEAAADGTR